MNARRFLLGLNRGFTTLEAGLLVLILAALLLLANGQIILRNFFGTGILGADSIMRILVLWLALFGAMVATRRREHILIDVLSRTLSRQLRRYVEGGIDIFCALVCGVIAYFSIILVQLELEDGTVAVSRLPVWICQTVIPFSFLVMACRFLFQAVTRTSARSEETQL